MHASWAAIRIAQQCSQPALNGEQPAVGFQLASYQSSRAVRDRSALEAFEADPAPSQEIMLGRAPARIARAGRAGARSENQHDRADLARICQNYGNSGMHHI